MGEAMDIAGIDMYQTRPELLTAVDDLMRASAGTKPWAVLEMGGNLGRWQENGEMGHNKGRLKATLINTLAGAELASLLRFQPSPSGSEQSKDDSSGCLRDAFSRTTETIDECAEAKKIINKADHLSQPIGDGRIAIVWDLDDVMHSECGVVAGKSGETLNDYPRDSRTRKFAHTDIDQPTRTLADWSA